MTYDPKEYWGKPRKQHCMSSVPYEELQHLATVMGNAANVKRVLEVGSGWGRLYLHIAPLRIVDEFRMCDFVELQRSRCKAATGITPDKWDGKTLPYNDKSFDMVVSFDVLLHVPPKDLDTVLHEHVRVSRQWLYIATFAKASGKLAAHCFLHDYWKRFTAMGLHVSMQHEFGVSRSHYLLEKTCG